MGKRFFGLGLEDFRCLVFEYATIWTTGSTRTEHSSKEMYLLKKRFDARILLNIENPTFFYAKLSEAQQNFCSS